MKKTTVSKARYNKAFYYTTSKGEVVELKKNWYDRSVKAYCCTDREGRIWFIKGGKIVEQ